MKCTLFTEIHFVQPGVFFGPWKLRGDVNVHAPYAQSSCLAGSVHLRANEPSCLGSKRRGREPEPDEVTHAGDTIGGCSLCKD